MSTFLLCWNHHGVSFCTSTIRQASAFQQLHGSPSVEKRPKIIKLHSSRRTPRHRTVHNANSRFATDDHAPVRILNDIVSHAVCAHTSCNFVSLSTNSANSNRHTHSEYPKKNLRSHSLHRLRHCVHRLVEMIGLDPLMQTLELSQPEVCFLGPSSAGNRLSTLSLSHHRCLSCLPFSSPFHFLPFSFAPCTCPMTIGADESRAMCCPPSSKHLCASVHSRTCTQVSARLTICQGNHFQEITVGCCRMFHHNRHSDRLPEVCTCGNSVLCNVCLPWSKHFTIVATLVFFIFTPTGTWVEDASQKRCCAISTCALVLFFEHSPRLKAMTSWNQGNHGQSFAVTFRDEHGINCSAFRQTVVIQAVVCDERPLFCSNIQVRSQVFQRSTYAFNSPTLQVCVSPAKSGNPMVFIVSRMLPFAADVSLGLSSRFLFSTTASRVQTNTRHAASSTLH